VPELNELLKDASYDERIFKTVTGRKVAKLWKLYKEHLGGGGGDGDGPTKDDPPTSGPESDINGSSDSDGGNTSVGTLNHN